MKKVPFVISIVTLYAIFFNIAPHMGITIEIIFALFFLSPFLILYMAYVILKYGSLQVIPLTKDFMMTGITGEREKSK